MTRFKVGALALVLLAACLPPRAPASAYGEALQACDKQPSEIEWIECCVKAAQTYRQDPNFCFQ